MLSGITPKYTGRVFAIGECPVPLVGESINKHLQGCKSVLICAATLGEKFDRLLRQLQLTDMAGAVVLDLEAGKFLEEFCNQKDNELLQSRSCNYRFSPGYGDFPLSVNRDIINVLNASTKIGLCVTDDFILTPQKSITGIRGIL